MKKRKPCCKNPSVSQSEFPPIRIDDTKWARQRIILMCESCDTYIQADRIVSAEKCNKSLPLNTMEKVEEYAKIAIGHGEREERIVLGAL